MATPKRLSLDGPTLSSSSSQTQLDAPWDHTSSPIVRAIPSPPPSYTPSRHARSNLPHTSLTLDFTSRQPISFQDSNSELPTYTSSPNQLESRLAFGSATPEAPDEEGDERASKAERLFWLGFAVPLVFWPMGFMRLWQCDEERERTTVTVEERVETGDGEDLWRWSTSHNFVNAMYQDSGEVSKQHVEQNMDQTREWDDADEKTWAKRCGICFVGFVFIAATFTVIVLNIVDVL
ncbi:hypothetical protein ACM66B_002956 [Microbotryomycetes sp. NB124-2]